MGRRRCGRGCCSFGRIGGGGHRCHCIVVLVVVVIVVEFIVALIIRLIIKLKNGCPLSWLVSVVVAMVVVVVVKAQKIRYGRKKRKRSYK